MTRSAYIDRERQILLFWSPKCGSTTIRDWWYAATYGKSPEEMGIVEKRQHLRRQRYEIDFTRLKKLEIEKFTKIAVSRHPFSRMVSVFVDMFIGKNGNRDQFHKLKGFAAEFWCEVRGVPHDEAADRYDGLSFDEFLNAVASRIETREGEPKLNRHWNTQVPFALEHSVPYDFRFDLKDMGSAFELLNEKTGATFIPPARRTFPYLEFDGSYLGNLPSLEMARSRRQLHPENFRSPEAEAIVRRAFDIDYRIFGYDR